MTRLHLDFETRSPVDIVTEGLDRYARQAEVLMLAWAFDNEEPQLWCTSDDVYDSPPRELWEGLNDRAVQKVAWNAAFERAIFRHCLGLEIPIDQWIDPSQMARYATLPAHLKDCCEWLQLGELAKHASGTRLIAKFCKPRKKGGYNTGADFPEDWELFKQYCLQDVRAEREVLHRLEKLFTLPPFEQRVAQIDAEINERGIPVDMQFVSEAKKLVAVEKAQLMSELQQLTGLANPNSGAQMLPWLKERGYPFSSLLKKKVDLALKRELPEEVVRVLTLRAKLSRSSTSKLDAITDRVGPDDRIRYSYKYFGASRTGRWSGSGVQLQNLPR